ncbi:hypothetical protein LCGC14_2525640 [marine sediment metagenome]|uniref:Uncharacterized protein n=1 Tax=marine sediment metagenome TaxID=412755 RepID=A0A0F9D6M4_9ZZZZ
MDALLTRKEMAYCTVPTPLLQGRLINPELVAKAQSKKIAEWGNEGCYDHNGVQRLELGWHVHRRECPICWKELLKEIG